jgi:beta-propeller repeat-containing protein
VQSPIFAASVAVAIVLAIPAPTGAEEPYEIQWTAEFDIVDGLHGPTSVAVDSAGYVYLSGPIFNEVAGTFLGLEDTWLVKFDPSGDELWRAQFGSQLGLVGKSVAVDLAGDVFLTGTTDGNLAGTNQGGTDAWLAKFNSVGDELWRTQFGSSDDDRSNSVAVDSAGDVYLTGFTNGDLAGTNQGYEDAWLAKFNSAGHEVWKTQFGSPGGETSYSVAVNSAGNAYVAVNGSLAKLNSAGHEIWRSPIISNHAWWVAADSTDDIYVTGFTYADGEKDALLAKFNSAGEEVWRTQYGSSGPDTGSSVVVDSAGDVYLTGHTGYFDELRNAFESRSWLAKFDSAGNALWSTEFGSDQSSSRWAHSVAVNSVGDVYVSGYDGVDPGGFSFRSDQAAFLAKFSPIPEPSARVMLILFSATMVLHYRFVQA